MNCRAFDMLLGLAPHELSADERRRIAAHLDSCAACSAQHEKYRSSDALLAAATAALPVRGSGRAAQKLRAPRTRLLVRLAWWGTGIHRAGRAVAPAAMGVALLVLGVWLASSVRPRAGPNALASLEQGAPPKNGTGARVWLLRATPKPDTPLQGEVPFEVHVGYQLYTARSALLSVRVVDVPSGQTRYFSPPRLVSAADERAVVSFVLDSRRARSLFGAGQVQLEAVLRDAAPGAEHAVLASEIFGGTRYVIR